MPEFYLFGLQIALRFLLGLEEIGRVHLKVLCL